MVSSFHDAERGRRADFRAFVSQARATYYRPNVRQRREDARLKEAWKSQSLTQPQKAEYDELGNEFDIPCTLCEDYLIIQPTNQTIIRQTKLHFRLEGVT